MKTKITIKAIRQMYDKVYYCGYCDLYNIMRYHEPAFYNCGVYGWNCDIYVDIANDIAITTGYRNMTGKRIPSELIEKYSKTAKHIMADSVNAKFDEIINALEENRDRFYEELSKI